MLLVQDQPNMDQKVSQSCPNQSVVSRELALQAPVVSCVASFFCVGVFYCARVCVCICLCLSLCVCVCVSLSLCLCVWFSLCVYVWRCMLASVILNMCWMLQQAPSIALLLQLLPWWMLRRRPTRSRLVVLRREWVKLYYSTPLPFRWQCSSAFAALLMKIKWLLSFNSLDLFTSWKSFPGKVVTPNLTFRFTWTVTLTFLVFFYPSFGLTQN